MRTGAQRHGVPRPGCPPTAAAFRSPRCTCWCCGCRSSKVVTEVAPGSAGNPTAPGGSVMTPGTPCVRGARSTHLRPPSPRSALRAVSLHRLSAAVSAMTCAGARAARLSACLRTAGEPATRKTPDFGGRHQLARRPHGRAGVAGRNRSPCVQALRTRPGGMHHPCRVRARWPPRPERSLRGRPPVNGNGARLSVRPGEILTGGGGLVRLLRTGFPGGGLPDNPSSNWAKGQHECDRTWPQMTMGAHRPGLAIDDPTWENSSSSGSW